MSRGIMLKNHVIETITSSRSAIHCYNLCFLRDSCQSINYNKISHICELNDETVTSFPKDSTASSGYSYYSTDICKQVKPMTHGPTLYDHSCMAYGV